MTAIQLDEYYSRVNAAAEAYLHRFNTDLAEGFSRDGWIDWAALYGVDEDDLDEAICRKMGLA